MWWRCLDHYYQGDYVIHVGELFSDAITFHRSSSLGSVLESIILATIGIQIPLSPQGAATKLIAQSRFDQRLETFRNVCDCLCRWRRRRFQGGWRSRISTYSSGRATIKCSGGSLSPTFTSQVEKHQHQHPHHLKSQKQKMEKSCQKEEAGHKESSGERRRWRERGGAGGTNWNGWQVWHTVVRWNYIWVCGNKFRLLLEGHLIRFLFHDIESTELQGLHTIYSYSMVHAYKRLHI